MGPIIFWLTFWLFSQKLTSAISRFDSNKSVRKRNARKAETSIVKNFLNILLYYIRIGGDPTGKILEHSYTDIVDSLVEVSKVLQTALKI